MQPSTIAWEGSYSIVDAIKQLQDDSSVRAVVLRIESPGGSSLASDVMWRELTLLAKAKPLVPVVVQLPAQRTAPGRITTYGPALFIVGDDAPSREFAALFDGSFLKVQCDADFRTREWEKLCLNAASGSLTRTTRRT